MCIRDRSHLDQAAVTALTGWGDASLANGADIEPGNWSLDNFGQILIATIFNGRTFTWQPLQNNTNALTTRATIMSGAPTKSIMTIVSDQDRHLIHLGTETTIGNNSTQDKMFIRFSNQEDFNTYEPTSVNTAGTFRLDDGTEIRSAIRAKDYILITTDTAAYTLQFVGARLHLVFERLVQTADVLDHMQCNLKMVLCIGWMTRVGLITLTERLIL